MHDPTEIPRRILLAKQHEEISQAESEDALEAKLRAEHGQLWNTRQLQDDFTVESFMAPFVVVTRKSDGKRGSMMFTHMPRWYYGFTET